MDDDSTRQIDWLADWDRKVQPAKQRAYVEQELRRLHAAGEPLLYACLTTPLADQRDVAVSVLRTVLGPFGGRVFLRLRPGAAPPPLDPQGRPVPTQHAGKLVAYLGEIGQMSREELQAAEESGESARYHATNRQQYLATSRAGLYRVAVIGASPVALTVDDAIVVLRAWGHGVRGEDARWRDRIERSLVEADPKRPELGSVEARKIVKQDTWLVEEVPLDQLGQPLEPTPVDKPAARAKSAAARGDA